MDKELTAKRVFEATPILKELLDSHGGKSISAYLREIENIKNYTPEAERKEELLNALFDILNEEMGQEHALRAREALHGNYFVSTADHHGPLCHPFFSQMFLARGSESGKKEKTMVIFPCASISMDNSSFPRGLFFHDETLTERRLPFFSLKYQHQSVLYAPNYTKKSLDKLFLIIEKAALKKETEEKLLRTLSAVYGDEKALSYNSYSSQITYTNYPLSQSVPGYEKIHLYYVPEEKIASRLLQKHLRGETAISSFLLQKKQRDILSSRLEGIRGAHDTKRNRGTYFFWGIKNGIRVQLYEKNGKLIDSNGNTYAELTKDSLEKGIKENRLMPNMALCFIVLSFYHGLACAGGFSQISYLTETKKAYGRFLKDIGEKSEADKLESLPTNIFLGEIIGVTIANVESVRPATLLDCILYGKKGFEAGLGETSMKTAILRMMPEYYKIITGQYPQNKESWLEDADPTITI